MRGQVVVREDPDYHGRKGSLILPDREVTHHVGTVLAKGPPAQIYPMDKPAVDVPHDFDVGDRVLYVWIHNEKAHTRTWPDDGKPAAWLPQACILAVFE